MGIFGRRKTVVGMTDSETLRGLDEVGVWFQKSEVIAYLRGCQFIAGNVPWIRTSVGDLMKERKGWKDIATVHP